MSSVWKNDSHVSVVVHKDRYITLKDPDSGMEFRVLLNNDNTGIIVLPPDGKTQVVNGLIKTGV